MRRFGRLAQALGYFFFVAPSRDLMTVRSAPCGQEPGETITHAYLRCGIPDSARYADAFEIQSQAHERDTLSFRSFVSRASAMARAANPDVLILAGISTSPGFEATCDSLVSAWSAVTLEVDGFYLTVNTVDIDTALAFFAAVMAVEQAAASHDPDSTDSC